MKSKRINRNLMQIYMKNLITNALFLLCGFVIIYLSVLFIKFSFFYLTFWLCIVSDIFIFCLVVWVVDYVVKKIDKNLKDYDKDF